MSKLDMVRSRWYVLASPLSIKGLAAGLLQKPFSQKEGAGFDLMEANEFGINGTFIAKIIETVSLADPFGETVENELIRFVRIRFTISKIGQGKYILRVLNATRSLKLFFRNLVEAFGKEFSFSNLHFGIKELCEKIITDRTVPRYSILSVKADSIPFTKKSIACIQITSQYDALKELESVFDRGSYNLKRIKVFVRLNSDDGIFELTNGGVVHSTENLVSLIQEKILQIADF